LKITFLGTGSSMGIPVIGCDCDVCASNNPKDKRLRSSVLIETGNNIFVIDAGPDFRQQMLLANITKIDAVLLTHEHKDHTAGLDDVRAFNFLMKKPMSIYAEDRVLDSIKHEFAYVFSENKYPGTPKMDLRKVENKPFEIGVDEILPIQVFHNLLPVFGFRFGNMAYVTDVKTIPEVEKQKLTDLDVLVFSAIRKKPHIAHMGLDETIDAIEELKPKRTYLTHISHMQHSFKELEALLPANVFVAYDQLVVNNI
jgi:phosphoribosyl 1,2-cyclic phosphate phosphodiesterase